jgi:EmrB/QacA subfamily drug resistance transporter
MDMTETVPARPPQTADAAYDRRWWTLAVLCLSLVMVVVGNTVLNVALPTLVRELAATSTQLEWMVDSYGLVFAGLLLTAGALGDRYGRKGMLTTGLLIFGGASVVSAFATSPVHIIVTRAVMGLGAALVMPATLSILTTVFPPDERAKAIGIWAGLAGAGAALGPIIGGWLLGHFWWGSVFLVNVPIIAAAFIGGRLFVPTSRDPRQSALDPIGAVLSILGLGALLYAIIEAPLRGWLSPTTVGVFVLAVVILVGFVQWERRVDEPMLDLRFFRDPRFSAAAGTITLVFFAMFGTFFLSTLYMQQVLGYTALGAGIRTLPMAVVMMIVAPSSARLVERFGPRRVVTAGLVFVGIGMFLLATLTATTPYWLLAPRLMVLALGMGLSSVPSTTSIMSALPMGKAGVGSAVNDTTRELGGALGVAVLGSVMTSRYAASIAGSAPVGTPIAVVRRSLGAALAIAHQTPGPAGAHLATAARNAFMHGMTTAAAVAGVVAFLAAAFVARFLPNQIRFGSAIPEHPHVDVEERSVS